MHSRHLNAYEFPSNAFIEIFFILGNCFFTAMIKPIISPPVPHPKSKIDSSWQFSYTFFSFEKKSPNIQKDSA